MSSYSVPGITAATKESPTSRTKPNRLPAPTLFVGPPSRNASQLSVSRQGVGKPDVKREKSTRTREYNPNNDGATDSPDSPASTSGLKKPSEKAVEARWREMQSTLNEVELTAQSSTHVFGEAHAASLDDLRNAQVALAKAWGRGNEDKTVTAAIDDAQGPNVGRFKGAEDIASDRQNTHGMGTTRKRADTGMSTASASTVLSDESLASDEATNRAESPASGRKSQLEDETAQDIKLASERRAANEAYFKKVDQGVKEVVEKLEKVAEAMRGVEGESRSLWSMSTDGSSPLSPEETERKAVGTLGAGG